MKKLTFIFIILFCFSMTEAKQSDFSKNIDLFFDHVDLEREPACAVGVIKNNEFLHKAGYGMANMEHGIKITPDSVFRMGSISKQFTAMSLALLEESGHLSFDDTVKKHIPDLIDYKDNVTIRHLIHHFSGLGDYEYSDYPDRFLNAIDEEFRWGNQDYMSNDEIYSLFKTLPLIMKPETKFWYSNLGYGLLGQVVENISNMSLREFSDKNIFEPLQMSDSFFNDNVNLIVKNRTDAYSPRENYPHEYEINMTNLSNVGDGGVYTTINDFIKWDHNFYQNKLGNKESDLIRTMEQNFFKKSAITSRQNNKAYRDEDTYAFAQNFDYKNGKRRWSHSGSWVGYTANYSRFEDLRFSVMVFCNNEGIDASEISDKIIDLYFKGSTQ
ncbi:MAG TPA: serine hydrolase domain-containing protein [Woeseiaceae bacterium]|nr:serine hydrolase domain-containing protein [Woeseiaceae bacterium]